MKRLAAVVVREWAAQRNVALIALPLAGVPWLLALHSDVIALVAATLGAGFLFSVSIALGATMMARDIAERRLSFYLARPLRAGSIWLGKLIANATLVTACSAWIALPALRLWPRWWLWAALPMAVFLLALGNYVSLVVRAGGFAVPFDLFLLAIAGALAVATPLPFHSKYSPRAGAVTIVLWCVPLFVAVLLAGARAARGAAFDVRVAAATARRALWPVAYAFGVIPATAYALYVAVLPPLRPVPISAEAINDEWVAVIAGSAGRLDYARFFLLNARTGERIDFHKQLLDAGGRPVASADGEHFYWNLMGDWENRRIVHLVRRRGRLEELPVRGELRAVSPDGSRIAVDRDTGTTIYDVAAGRELRHFDRDCCRETSAAFLDRDHLRLLEVERGAAIMRTIDLRNGVEAAMTFGVPEVLPFRISQARLLEDGRLVTFTMTGKKDTGEVRVFAADGRQERTITFLANGWELHRVSRSVVVVWYDNVSQLIDVDRGTVCSLPRIQLFEGAVTIVGTDVVRIDPATGRSTVILRGRLPSVPPKYRWFRDREGV